MHQSNTAELGLARTTAPSWIDPKKNKAANLALIRSGHEPIPQHDRLQPTTEIKVKSIKKPAQPTTFHQRLIAYENERHAKRLAEIKKVETKLQMFEPTVAALEARGISLALNYPLLAYPDGLHASRGGITEWDHPLYTALTELGFAEIERRDYSYSAEITLKQGRLTLYMSILAGYPASASKDAQVQTPALPSSSGEITA